MAEIQKTIRILILDDVETIRKTLKEQLLEMGMTGEIQEAATVKEANDILFSQVETEKAIEFILSDWNLPDGTGLELLKKVRGDQRFDRVPYLMITTESDVGHMLEAVNAGSTNYMVKPWSKEELASKLQNCWDIIQQKFGQTKFESLKKITVDNQVPSKGKKDEEKNTEIQKKASPTPSFKKGGTKIMQNPFYKKTVQKEDTAGGSKSSTTSTSLLKKLLRFIGL